MNIAPARLVAAALCLVGALGASEPSHTATTELRWSPAPVPGASLSVVWGNPMAGAHGTYMRFPGGAATKVHTHSHSYRGVVITGSMRHWVEGQPETKKALPPGSHWTMPANVSHVSECLPGVECVALVTQEAAFDFHVVSGSGSAKLDDADIFGIFDRANAQDIATAKLGVRRARSAKVRELASMVARDHTAVRQSGGDLAKKLGVTPTRMGPDANHERALKLLQSHSGEEFDRAYLEHEIEFHSAVIDAVRRTLLPTIENPEFRQLVVDVLPGFERHLAMTIATAEELGYR